MSTDLLFEEWQRSNEFADRLVALCQDRQELVVQLRAERLRIELLLTVAERDLHACLEPLARHARTLFEEMELMTREAIRRGEIEAAVRGARFLAHKQSELDRHTFAELLSEGQG